MSNIRYTEDHEWLRDEGDGTVTVGITDHAQDSLGELVYVQLPEAGVQFAAGDELAVIESVKAASEIRAPLAGTITEVNAAIVDEPKAVNDDPLGAGWFFRMKLDDAAALSDLLDEAAYRKLVG